MNKEEEKRQKPINEENERKIKKMVSSRQVSEEEKKGK